jgi:hypothetical protein
MEGSDQLLAIAEIGATFTRFTGGIGFSGSYDAYFLGLLLFLVIASVNFVALMRAGWANDL